MSKNTLYNKIWDRHKVTTLPTGQDQLLIGLHLIHEVTSPQAFAMLRERQSRVLFPNRTFATIDHVVPTDNLNRPFADDQAELMAKTLEANTQEFGIQFFHLDTGQQGVVHIVGPELGLTQPGMTIACGDSHTSTHGAFGSLAFGIGSTEVRNILETQTLALSPLKVRQIIFDGKLEGWLSAKDVILKIIQTLGVNGGLGYAYEYSGSVIEQMNMDERMTVCNMSIEGGARIGYINPDETTYQYMKGRQYVPTAEHFEKAKSYWNSVQTSDNAEFDDIVHFSTKDLEPMVTWGITPGQALGVSEHLPELAVAPQAYEYMRLKPGSSIRQTPIDVVFIGSCTNGRLSDLKIAAKVLKSRKVHPNVKTLVVPGSQVIKKQAEEEGLDQIFIQAGAEWREAGCSMCLAMNPDKLIGDQICASTSNRNFMGRQGSSTGRTLLMSPAMAAYAAVKGQIADVREIEID